MQGPPWSERVRGPARGYGGGVDDLRGKVAWVTGGASGIGRASAARLAAAGARVGLIDLQGPLLGEAAEALGATPAACDVADAAAVDATVAALTWTTGPPDVLVNAAGIARSSPVASFDEDTWQRVLAVNLTGAMHVTRAVLGGMLERGFGRVVNVASGTAVRVSAGTAAYASSKAGLIAFTKVVAVEGATRGVTANAVAPGLVDTPLMRAVMPTDEALRAAATASPIANPMGVVLEPDDVAHAVLFLALPASRYITGQVLHVNAGALMP